MRKQEVPHWYQVRNSVFAGLIVAGLAGVWHWTGNVGEQIAALRTSLEDMHHDRDGAEATRVREQDRLEQAIVRNLNVDEGRLSALEACACRS